MKNFGLFLKAITVVIVVVCFISIISLRQTQNELTKQKEDLEKQVFEAEEEVAELRYKLSLPYNDDYAARVAREQLKYYFPDEIIFKNAAHDE